MPERLPRTAMSDPESEFEFLSELDQQYDPHEVEADINGFWDDVDAYETVREEGIPDFYFLDGPPFTSGQMHLGTAWNKTLKDAIIRYLRMQGHSVYDRPGYDMHGLPIETKVEEKFGFESKKDIAEASIDTFIQECRTFAEENLEKMNEDFQSLGVWMDWDDPYRTASNEYIEGVWWGFKQAYDRGHVDRGHQVINQCPRCETAIADNEVEYEDIDSPSIYVKFPLVDEPGSLVIWTTTPWTLPANLYVAVDEELEYARLRLDGDEEVIVASNCVEEVVEAAGADSHEVLETMPGSDLVGASYRSPLGEQVPAQAEYDDEPDHHQVYATDFVEAERTGLIHSAPGHGVEDAEFGEKYGLDVFAPVATDGVFTDDAGEYAGQQVWDANDEIIADLEASGALLSSGTVSHRYGHCWRCDTPIINMATAQWFIRVSEIKDRLLEELEESTWHPEWARDNRQRNWIEDARDWCVSRQRYWGTPLPIWENDDGDIIVIESVEELRERADQEFDPADIDLHRPEVDEITITEDGEEYHRVPDVFDVWVDSGVTSWAAIDYPNRSDLFDEMWPTELIVEAHDQTRGWFWSQLGMGVTALDQNPYEEVVMHGHALDEDGLKMSKSRGNIVTPQEAIDRHGADPVRSFLLTRNLDGEDMRFSWEEIGNQADQLNIVWNVFRFPAPYMRMDGFDPREESLADADLRPIDEWVLSRLESTKQVVGAHMDDYALPEAFSAVLSFLVEDVSRFYIQSIRDRVWEPEDSADKHAAYLTLYRLFDESSRLLAPFVPHIAERLYQTFVGSETTVHDLDWPAAEAAYHDTALEAQMETVQAIEKAASNARQNAGRKLRWPVSEVIVSTDEADVVEAATELEPVLRDRINCRDVTVVEGTWDGVEFVARPQMDVLGPEFGGEASAIADAIRGMTRAEFEADPTITVDGDTIEVTEEMVDFRKSVPEHVSAAEFGQGSVYVDLTITDDIRSEGYAREVIRRVQEMRKEMDLDLHQSIELDLQFEDAEADDLIERHRELIAQETRCENYAADADDYVETWEFEGVTVTIGVATV